MPPKFLGGSLTFFSGLIALFGILLILISVLFRELLAIFGVFKVLCVQIFEIISGIMGFTLGFSWFFFNITSSFYFGDPSEFSRFFGGFWEFFGLFRDILIFSFISGGFRLFVSLRIFISELFRETLQFFNVFFWNSSYLNFWHCFRKSLKVLLGVLSYEILRDFSRAFKNFLQSHGIFQNFV